MELPIFNDNLKSSASWNQLLAQAQTQWERTQAATWPAIRETQVTHLLARAGLATDAAPRIRQAAELISAWAATPEFIFDLAHLLESHRVLAGAAPGADVLRQTEPLPLNPLHDPVPALLLPRMLDNAFDWFSTEGFKEMHAVEQAAVVFLRLLDLHPFPQLSETTALLAASFYTERAGLPPLFVFNDEVTLQRYANVTETAFRMLTQPLVEFFVELLQRAMSLVPE